MKLLPLLRDFFFRIAQGIRKFVKKLDQKFLKRCPLRIQSNILPEVSHRILPGILLGIFFFNNFSRVSYLCEPACTNLFKDSLSKFFQRFLSTRILQKLFLQNKKKKLLIPTEILLAIPAKIPTTFLMYFFFLRNNCRISTERSKEFFIKSFTNLFKLARK